MIAAGPRLVVLLYWQCFSSLRSILYMPYMLYTVYILLDYMTPVFYIVYMTPAISFSLFRDNYY